MKIHESITQDRVMDAVQRSKVTLDNPGFCIKCGAEAEGVEPDAENYKCDSCGERGVHGAEQILIVFML